MKGKGFTLKLILACGCQEENWFALKPDSTTIRGLKRIAKTTTCEKCKKEAQL